MCNKIGYWFIVVLTAIAGPFKAYGAIELRLYLLKATTLGKFWSVTSFNLAGICMIFSGVILVRSVKKIHNFFKDHRDEAFLDTRAMNRHASCFVIYLFTTVAYYGTFSWWAIRGIQQANAVFWYVASFYWISQLISLSLLAKIFLDIISDEQ